MSSSATILACPHCQTENHLAAENCIQCGKGLFGLTRGAVLNGRYEILGLLGRGGMGVVYKGLDRELEEPVAIKVLRPDVARVPDVAKRFRSEIRLARRVRHKNVCAIHEYGQEGHIRYIVMEHIEGIDVKEMLRQSGALPETTALRVTLQAAEGLHAIHEAGIVHRDLKTANLMIDKKNHVRLMDFGIAKSLDTGSTPGVTATGQIIGTPEYMSPEQVRGEAVDRRSDLYALGIVAYELFTGDVPFRGDTPMATLFMHLQDPPDLEGAKAARLPAAIVPVLRRLLAKEREERYDSAEVLAADLRAALPHVDTGTPAMGAGPAIVLPEAHAGGQTAAMPGTALRSGSLPLPGLSLSPTVGWDGSTTGAARAPWARQALIAAVAVVTLGVAAVWYARIRVEPLPAAAQVAPPIDAPAARPAQAEHVTPALTAPPPATTTIAPPVATTVRAASPPRAVKTTAPPVVDDGTVRARIAAPLPTEAPPAGAALAPAITAADVGRVQVGVKPWAHVSVDDREAGTAPLVLQLPAGAHRLVLTHPDYQPIRRFVTVRPGETVKVEVDFGIVGIPK